jgi:hypothetical protein
VTNTPHVTLFVDGIPKVGADPGGYFSGDLVMQADSPESVLRIGGRDDAGGYTTFNGLMDEVQIYNHTLDRDQVKYLFDNPAEVILPPDIPVIRRQPLSQTVMAGATVTFTVEAEARTPLNYQWQFQGVNLPGATNPTLTLSPATTNHAGTYRVVVSNIAGTATSDPATLTVNVDTTPPTLQNIWGVVTGPFKFKEVVVVFSEPVTPASAGLANNYSLNRGVTISTVTVDGPTTVRLRASDLTPVTVAYTLTVNNVRDTAFGVGNVIAPDTRMSFFINVYLPLDIGQTVNGYQDDFEGATRNPNWIAAGLDLYQQADGVLKVPTIPDDPNHLLYQAPGYDDAAQEVLARIKINAFTAGGGSRAGVAVASNPQATHPGEAINLLFIDFDLGGVAGPQFRLLNDWVAWGPTPPPEWRSWRTNTWYWLRLRQTSSTGANNISGKVWLGDGTVPEPAQWQLTWTQAGRTGFAGIQGPSGGATDFEVDYVLIKATGLPSIQVAGPSAIPLVTGIVSLTITQQPQSVISAVNGTATFTVGATSSGPDPLVYQWQKNNLDIAGANASSYTTPPLTVADQGAQYRVLISTPGANVFSAPAVLGIFALNRYSGITIYGLPGRQHQIQYAETVGQTTNWVPLATLTLPTSPYIYYDIQSTNVARRFYRAVLLP